MSNNNIDDLLKNRLEGYSKKAPESAWSRIESNRKGKTIGGWKLYLSIAASLISILVITFALLNSNEENGELNTLAIKENLDTTKQISQPEIVTSEVVQAEVQSMDTLKDYKSNNIKRSPQKPNNFVKNFAAVTQDKKDDVESQQQVEPVKVKPEQQETVLDNSLKIENVIADSKENSLDDIKVDSVAKQEFKIPFEVTKTETLADAGVNETEETKNNDRGISFKKILDIAKDLKSDNNTWSSLREAKNEFLTFGRNKNDESE